MSSAFRHISHGMAGDTGAPRPTLVNSAAGVFASEHDMAIAIPAATSKPQPPLEKVIRIMGAHDSSVE